VVVGHLPLVLRPLHLPARLDRADELPCLPDYPVHPMHENQLAAGGEGVDEIIPHDADELVDVHLVLPLVVLALTLFRKNIKNLLERISSVAYKDAAIEFSDQLRAAEKASKKVEVDLDGQESIPQVTVDIENLREKHPQATIVMAWLFVEDALTRKINEFDGELWIKGIQSTQRKINYLYKEGLVNQNVVSFYRELAKLRNSAAHELDANISEDDAERFVRYVEELVAIINQVKICKP